MAKYQIFDRYEMKYHLPVREMDVIRSLTAPYVRFDPHAACRPGGVYTVRSIYFDTDDLRYYYEKRDGLKIRKKLRIRTYNRSADDSAIFLEIKRKLNRCTHKERLSLRFDQVEAALNGASAEAILDGRPFTDRVVLDRFRFCLRTSQLKPVVLVSYEREAYIGVENPSIRVTFDQDIRSLINPELDQIFDERELRQFEDEWFVLELKFDHHTPVWMARLISQLNLRARPYSKYCRGIEAWDRRARQTRQVDSLYWGAAGARG